MTNENNESKEKKLPDPFGVIERAGDFPLVIQVLSLALFLEALLLGVKHKNLLTFGWQEMKWASEVGEIIVAGLIYALILSVLLPLFEAVMTMIFAWHPINKLLQSSDEIEAEKRPGGCVRDRELKLKADEAQSTYLLDMYQRATVRRQSANRQVSNLGTGALRVMVMLGLNIYFSSQDTPSSVMLAKHLWSPDTFNFILALAFFALFCLSVRSWRRDPFRTLWIYYPPLYKEIMEERKEQRKLHGA
jgi:hypothetical protein